MAFLNRRILVGSRSLCCFEGQFLTCCLTIKQVGLWAAGILGLGGDEAAKYAQGLTVDFVESNGVADLGQRIQADFQAKGLEVSPHRIDMIISRQWEEARRQVALRYLQVSVARDGGWDRRGHPRGMRAPAGTRVVKREPLFQGFMGLLSSMGGA
ncbi:MAG: ATPase inhibitor subunit zeta, partial [Rhodospirillaceae bacterium]